MKLRLVTILAVVLAVIGVCSVSYAADLSHEGGLDNRQGREKSMSQKSSVEQRDSQTKRNSKSTTRGGENNRSRSNKESASASKSRGLDLAISARDLFGDDAMEYRLPADFGLSAVVGQGGLINQTYQDWLYSMARSNTLVSQVTDEKTLRAYFRNVAEKGAIIGQAMIYLQGDLAQLGGVKRTKNAFEIIAIGADDLLALAQGAHKRAQAGISDARIRNRLEEILSDQAPCRLAGDPTSIKCGKSLLTLTVPPKLTFRGVEWYGHAYAGLDATYKVSSSWSWSQSLEHATTDSTFGRWAREQSEAAERLEAKGLTRDAVKTRREAVEKIRANKTSIGPGRFLPSAGN